jgi:hypothetical protein
VVPTNAITNDDTSPTPTPPTPTPTPTPKPEPASSSTPVAPIMGGTVVAGVVAIAAIVAFAWYKVRTKRLAVQNGTQFGSPSDGSGNEAQRASVAMTDERDMAAEVPVIPSLRYPEERWPEKNVSELVGGRLSAGY